MKRLLILLTLYLITGCQQESTQSPEQAQPVPQKGGIYNAALPWSPRDLDPAFSTDVYSGILAQHIFDGLVQFDENLNIIPALARTWKVSHDGVTYTFELRHDAKFHNGRPVTAHDFVYSFSRILHPQKDSSALSLFQRIRGAGAYRRGETAEIQGLKALDDHTLEITINEPFAPFLSILAMINSKVVPKEEIERWGKDFSRHPVGAGPFRLESWEEDKLVLRANPDYYEGRPYLDRVVYTIYPGAQYDKVYEDFLAGHLDEAAVFGVAREQLTQTTDYQFYRKPTLSLQFYGMNCLSGALKEKKVRQALNYAIDKQSISREVYKGQFLPASTILPPGMPGYTPENAAYGYDPDKARALLSQAGYGPSEGKLSLTLLSASRSNAAQEELARVASDLATVGVELKVQYETDWPTFEATLQSGNFQLYRYAWIADIPDPDNFLNVLCNTESVYNYMQYSNSEVDQLLSRALVEIDTLKRVTLYRQAERIVLDDAPMIPWIYLTFESVFQPYVRGLEISALGRPYIPLKQIWKDKL